jgi:cell division protein FtsB
MTARRGSLRFKVSRFARAPLARAGASVTWRRRLMRWAVIGSRVLVWAVVLCIGSATASQFWRIGAQNYHLHRQIDAVEGRNAALVSEAARLRTEATLLHDPDYLVPLIHEQLGLVKPHEVFIIVTPTPTPSGK